MKMQACVVFLLLVIGSQASLTWDKFEENELFDELTNGFEVAAGTGASAVCTCPYGNNTRAVETVASKKCTESGVDCQSCWPGYRFNMAPAAGNQICQACTCPPGQYSSGMLSTICTNATKGCMMCPTGKTCAGGVSQPVAVTTTPCTLTLSASQASDCGKAPTTHASMTVCEVRCATGYVGNTYNAICMNGMFSTDSMAMCYMQNQMSSVDTTFSTVAVATWTANAVAYNAAYRAGVIAASKVDEMYVGSTVTYVAMGSGTKASVMVTSSSMTYTAAVGNTSWTKSIKYTGALASATSTTMVDSAMAQPYCRSKMDCPTAQEPKLNQICTGAKWACTTAECCEAAVQCSTYQAGTTKPCSAAPYTDASTGERCDYGYCTQAQCCVLNINGVSALTPFAPMVWILALALALFV